MKIMIKYCILIICIESMLLGNTVLKAQCNDKLVDKVIQKSGKDALFIREFMLDPGSQNKKKKVESPAISSKYEVRLNKGIIYRFIVENEENSQSQAFLQLRKSNYVLAVMSEKSLSERSLFQS